MYCSSWVLFGYPWSMIKRRAHSARDFRMDCSGFYWLESNHTSPRVYLNPTGHPECDEGKWDSVGPAIVLGQEHFTLARACVWIAESWLWKSYSTNMRRICVYWTQLCCIIVYTCRVMKFDFHCMHCSVSDQVSVSKHLAVTHRFTLYMFSSLKRSSTRGLERG